MEYKVNTITNTKEVIVDTIQQVDLSDIKVPIVAIYEKPEDYPDSCVARIFDGEKATNTIMIASCIWILKYDIERHTNLVFLERNEKDVKSLIGTYI